MSEWGQGFLAGMGVGAFVSFYVLMFIVTMWTVFRDDFDVDQREDE